MTVSVLLGRARSGREIRAWKIGPTGSRRRVLVVGCIHGDEAAGEAITRALRRMKHRPAGTTLWLVDAFNPDGCIAHTRQNSRHVDLNRNSPWHWRPIEHPGGTYYSGPEAASEPETRAIMRFVRHFQPTLTIWYHQHAALVDASGGDSHLEREYAREVGLAFRTFGRFPGSITSWQNATSPANTAFVVELPPGRLPTKSIKRHVAAVLRIATERIKPRQR